VIPTFVIKLKTGWRGWSSVRKGRIEWHTNASARKQRKQLKLHLLLLGSAIVTPKRSSHSNNAIGCKFPIFLTWCTLSIYSHCLHIHNNVTLDYKNFATFYELIIFCKEVESYAIEHYLNLTCFVESWCSYKKHGFVPLVRPKRTPQSV
jgi:hypothetical protein